LLATIPGLEKVVVRRPGYAIEYDYVDPRELTPALEVRKVPAFTWLARSTAPQVMKKRQPRG